MKIIRITWHDFVSPARHRQTIFRASGIESAMNCLEWDLLHCSQMHPNAWQVIKVEIKHEATDAYEEVQGQDRESYSDNQDRESYSV